MYKREVLISVGGGGLISGVGSALKQFFPEIKIFGVEPDNAKGITESLKIGSPLDKVEINSIADSLCAPLHMPYSFDVAKKVIDQMVNVSDQEMINYMLYTFKNLKLLLEPACVAGFAALKKLNSSKFTQKSRKKMGVHDFGPKTADNRGPRIIEARIIEG